MPFYSRAAWITSCLLTMLGTGCCCTQGMNSCSGVVGCSSCPTNSCGTGPLMGLASCRGGCGETYVDEWVSEPPCVDDCGYCDTGCDRCRIRRPVRSFLRVLWGAPYRGDCGCDSGCSDGCTSCDGGMTVSGDSGFHGIHGSAMHSSGQAGCNCGGSHGSELHSSELHSSGLNSSMGHAPGVHLSPAPMSPAPSQSSPSTGSPRTGNSPAPAEAVPTPAPVTPSSAKRLSPAQQRSTVSRASTR